MTRKLIALVGLGLFTLVTFALGSSEVVPMKAKCDHSGCCGHCDRK